MVPFSVEVPIMSVEFASDVFLLGFVDPVCEGFLGACAAHSPSKGSQLGVKLLVA